MASLKTLAKDTAIYGLSSIIGRFLNYLLVPLYTYVLESCADYGIINDLYSQCALLLVVLTFGMETTFFRFMNKEERPESVFSTTLMTVACVALTFLATVLVFLPQVSSLLGYSAHPWYIGMMAIIVAQDAIQAILFCLLRYQKRPIHFACLKLLFIVMSVGLNLIAFVVLPKYVETWEVSVGYAFVINLFCTSVVSLLFIPELRRCTWGFDKGYLRAMLRYTWPMLILGVAGILNQVAGQIMLPRVLDQESGRHALGIYGACVKIAMIMAMITQAFRYAYEPIVFAGHQDRNNPRLLAAAMKYFVVFTLLAFVCVMAYLDLLQLIVGAKFREGLGIVPVAMAAEILMGVYFNLSFWYKLIDKTIYGAWFSIAGCAVLVIFNWIFIPEYGYWACAWAGLAGYGTATILSYVVGQAKNPIPYPLLSIASYVVLTAIFCGAMAGFAHYVGHKWLRLAFNTLCVLSFVGHIGYHELLPAWRARRNPRK